MEYKWNPTTEEMQKDLYGVPMFGCMVWISYINQCGQTDVLLARLETKDFREFNWLDAFSGDVIAPINDKNVTAWKYVDIPNPYEN